jgi:hypothetical protein
MGLLRIATVVAVGVALLPSDHDQQQRLYERASATAEWVVTFCDRNPDTCAKGSELWSQFVAKAQFGAKLAYDMMSERQGVGNQTAAAADHDDRPYKPAVLEREIGPGTLTPLDKEPAWRGKKASKGSI